MSAVLAARADLEKNGPETASEQPSTPGSDPSNSKDQDPRPSASAGRACALEIRQWLEGWLARQDVAPEGAEGDSASRPEPHTHSLEVPDAQKMPGAQGPEASADLDSRAQTAGVLRAAKVVRSCLLNEGLTKLEWSDVRWLGSALPGAVLGALLQRGDSCTSEGSGLQVREFAGLLKKPEEEQLPAIQQALANLRLPMSISFGDAPSGPEEDEEERKQGPEQR